MLPFIIAAVGGYLIGSSYEKEIFARGGVVKINNDDSSDYSSKREAFVGKNLEGKVLDNGDYAVLSYGYYPIWYWKSSENKWFKNKDKYSQTTSKQTNQSKPSDDFKELSKEAMEAMYNESFK